MLLPIMHQQHQLLQTGDISGQQMQMKSMFYLAFSIIWEFIGSLITQFIRRLQSQMDQFMLFQSIYY